MGKPNYRKHDLLQHKVARKNQAVYLIRIAIVTFILYFAIKFTWPLIENLVSHDSQPNDDLTPSQDINFKYDFYQKLPEVDLTKQHKNLIINVATFKNPQYATKLVNKLRSLDIDLVKQRIITNSNRSLYYQIIIGPYDDYLTATKIQDKLNANGIKKTFISKAQP